MHHDIRLGFLEAPFISIGAYISNSLSKEDATWLEPTHVDPVVPHWLIGVNLVE
jgi:hypothetical protein